MACDILAAKGIQEALVAVARIYLDNAATTPMIPEVKAAMDPWLSREYGNPSSLHAEGRRARQAIDQAREIVSAKLGCLFAEVLFTSSGTEAANLALLGVALANHDSRRRRILLGAAEHHCVLNVVPLLEKIGYGVERIPVDRVARVDMKELRMLMADDVLVVSVMHANNELGTLQPVAEVSSVARDHGALFHCDAVQTLGTRHLEDVAQFDLASFSAHKLHGPKGVGAIFIRAGTPVSPLAVGGGQEREMRAGTENVAGIVGFAAAVNTGINGTRRQARDVFLEILLDQGFVASVPNDSMILDGHAHVRCPGIDAETMLIRLDRAGVSASSGAACSSGSLEPSHVLVACGYTEREAKEGLRFTFSDLNTVEEARAAAAIVVDAARQIKAKGKGS